MPPFEIKPMADALTPKWAAINRGHLYQLGEAAEYLVVLGAWAYLYTNGRGLGGYTEAEIITYLVFGSVLALSIGWLEHLWLEDDLSDPKNELVRSPFRYLARLVRRDWYKAVLPFLFHAAVQAIAIIWFREQLVIRFPALAILAIFAFVLLSFVFDFLLSYWYRAASFWWVASPAKREFLDRIKRILAGNYFPLELLPAGLLVPALFLPFAYSFYVPAQLYLGRLEWNTVFMGVFVQSAWIGIVYWAIKRTVRQ